VLIGWLEHFRNVDRVFKTEEKIFKAVISEDKFSVLKIFSATTPPIHMSEVGYAWIQHTVGAPDFLDAQRARLAPVSRIECLEDGALLVPLRQAPPAHKPLSIHS
jgi:hypothetical protein